MKYEELRKKYDELLDENIRLKKLLEEREELVLNEGVKTSQLFPNKVID